MHMMETDLLIAKLTLLCAVAAVVEELLLHLLSEVASLVAVVVQKWV